MLAGHRLLGVGALVISALVSILPVSAHESEPNAASGATTVVASPRDIRTVGHPLQRGTGFVQEDLETYESPSYGYTITFDPLLWQVVESGSAEDTQGAPVDILALRGTSAAAQFIGRSAAYADAFVCLEANQAFYTEQDSITGVDVRYEDFGGGRWADRPDSLYFITFDYQPITDTGPGPVHRAYLQCQTIVAGASYLVTLISAPADRFAAEWPRWEDLLAGVQPPPAEFNPRPTRGTELAGVWTPSMATSTRAVSDCNAAVSCAYQNSEAWSELVLDADGTYQWAAPYATGRYEAMPLTGAGDFEVVLHGEDGQLCTGRYDASETELVFPLPSCPGFTAEHIRHPGVLQALEAGQVVFMRGSSGD